MTEAYPFNGGLATLSIGLSVAGVAVAVFWDLKERRIPNRLNAAMAIVLLVTHIVAGGVSGAGEALLAGMICFAAGVLLYAVGALGAGDAKLLGALGLGISPAVAWQLLARIALAGGVLGIGRLIADGNLGNAFWGLLSRARRAKAERSSVPYGVAIAVGFLWTVSGAYGWTL